MAKHNWMNIDRSDVIRAIEIFLNDNPEYPAPRSTFLVYRGKKLPAKHIRGIAYKVAYGEEVQKSEFGGGMETVRFFERLGFDVFYSGVTDREKRKYQKKLIKVQENEVEGQSVSKESLSESECKKKYSVKNKELFSVNNTKIKISSKRVIEQKNALQLLLNRLFDGDIVCEKTFSWLRTPNEIKDEYAIIYNALASYRGNQTFAKKNVQLRCYSG